MVTETAAALDGGLVDFPVNEQFIGSTLPHDVVLPICGCLAHNVSCCTAAEWPSTWRRLATPLSVQRPCLHSLSVREGGTEPWLCRTCRLLLNQPPRKLGGSRFLFFAQPLIDNKLNVVVVNGC
jgi:hypothetical protein